MGKGVIVKESTWSGPLPPPEALKALNDIVPNAAERILCMAEEEQRVRLRNESLIVEKEVGHPYFETEAFYKRVRMGQFMGLIALFAMIGGAIYAAHSGFQNLALAIVGISGFANIVTAFINQQRKDVNDRKK